jgi:hypothetical protein
MDEFNYEDYDYVPEYYKSSVVSEIRIRFKKTLKIEKVKELYNPSPTLVKIQSNLIETINLPSLDLFL